MYNHMGSDPLVGTLFGGRYLINFLIAKGGMGNIYQVNDIRTGRIVALKMLRSEFSADQIVVHRFEREVDAVACLKHPNICQLFESGCTIEGIHYFTMEYLVGKPLDQVLREEQVLEPEKAVNYIIQTASALCDAHNHGVIHRDLKPANIFIVHQEDEEDFIKVLDFGVAKVDDDVQQVQEKLTRAGSTLGTPYYMSPEQIQGLSVDGRTDVYALGVILWECLFGRPPFVGRNLLEIFDAAINDKLPKLPKPYRIIPFWKKVYRILAKALEKNREQRYSSMKDFLRALETLNVPYPKAYRISESTPKSLPSLNVVQQLHKVSPLKMVIFGTIAILLLGAVIGVVVYCVDEPVETPAQRFDTYKFFSDVPAQVIVNNSVLGTTPMSADLSYSVPFTIKFAARDIPEFDVTIRELSESVTGYAVNLAPRRVERPMAYVETVPPGADVFVNGVHYPLQTPCNIALISPTEVLLEFRHEGYRSEVIHVIPNGGDIKVRTNLFRP